MATGHHSCSLLGGYDLNQYVKHLGTSSPTRSDTFLISVISIVVVHEMAQSADTSDSTPFVNTNLTLSFYVISTATNILVTFLIAGRLLAHRRRMMSILGAHHADLYANVATIIVESAVLYSAFAIPFLVTFGLQDPVSNVFLNVVNSIQASIHLRTVATISLNAVLRV